VGPSGSGKSTVAGRAYGESLVTGHQWPEDRAIVDGFDLPSIKQVTGLLTAVGLSSPPAWIKPYRVLSGGEQFRCDLAYALSLAEPLVVFDEFTSVVDRNVARCGSAALSKLIRRGAQQPKFVAVSCHYDIARWLEPDWMLDMATGVLHRRRLRRPQIRLEVARCRHQAWRLFSRHHYLTAL